MSGSVLLKALVIFVGGGVGALLRFGLGWLVDETLFRRPEVLPESLPHFPMGTLCVNVLGCGAIGLLGAWLFQPGTDGGISRPTLRLLLIVGVLGGFTTFSSFAMEALRLAQAGRLGMAGLYVVLSNTLGLGAAWLGWVVGSRLD